MSARPLPECAETMKRVRENEGPETLGFLTGFDRRVASALCHLREAWSVADFSNRLGVERAMRALFQTRTLRERAEMYRRFVVDGLDDSAASELWIAVAPAADAINEMHAASEGR